MKKAARLFSRRGYFGVSMQDIAGEAGITKAALYYYYPSKEKLYQDVLLITFSDLLTALKKAFAGENTPWDKLLNVIETYLLFSLNRPEVNLFFKDELPPNDRETLKVVNMIRKKIISLFKGLIKTEAKGRKIASRQILILTTLLITALGKSVMIALFPPRLIAEQLVSLLFPKPESLKKSRTGNLALTSGHHHLSV